jgi:hypothetical protein
LHKVAPGVDVGNLVCATGAAFVRFALGRVLHYKVEFRFADRSGMAASMLLIAVVVDAVVLRFAVQ